jgi:hypothetical protein
MNDLLELNNYNKKPITGSDLLFNKNKISSEVASLSSSSLSSLSSASSERKPKTSSNKPLKFVKREEPEDDDDDDEEEGDDDEEGDEEDDDDDDEEGDEEDDDDDDRSITSNDSENRIVRKKRDEISEKREILYQLNRLEAKGYTIPGNYNMNSDLQEMKQEYERIVRDKDIDASIRFQRKMLMAFVSGTEYLNSRYDPFAIKLEGWSDQVHENITDYDDIFEELHEKYKSKGKKMAPELRLFISLTGSAFMFHLTSKMFKESSIPGVEEVFKANPELMKQFQNAAAKQFVYKNTGIGMDAPPPQQQQRPSQSNNGGLFGMIGNLFGGLNNSPAFNNSPKMPMMSQSRDKSTNDINHIINNVHNKITPNLDDDNRIETLSISDEEITSIIEDATDVNLLKKSVKGKNKRTLNI